MTTEQRLSRLESQFETLERVLQDLDFRVTAIDQKLELLGELPRQVKTIDGYYHVKETFWERVVFWSPVLLSQLLIIALIFFL